jgi:hypothetical protein
METILEFLLSLAWDTIKTLILQALIDYIKDWYDKRNNLKTI